MKSYLNDLNNLSMNSLLKALIRENFILKAQLGLLHDTLIDKGIIGEDELHPKLKQFLADLDEEEYKAYLIETAGIFESVEEEKIRS